MGYEITILTALVKESKRPTAISQYTSFVTYDQPLFWKAWNIVASVQQHPELQYLVVKLGGFHLLTSFLVYVGEFIAGRGLNERLQQFMRKTVLTKCSMARASLFEGPKGTHRNKSRISWNGNEWHRLHQRWTCWIGKTDLWKQDPSREWGFTAREC